MRHASLRRGGSEFAQVIMLTRVLAKYKDNQVHEFSSHCRSSDILLQ